DAATRYGIRTIPNLVLFKGGQEVARFSRAAPKSQLKAWLEGNL
ncbi:MAG: thiol reductase thioredoxin, partial [Sphingomonas hengshuiensis]